MRSSEKDKILSELQGRIDEAHELQKDNERRSDPAYDDYNEGRAEALECFQTWIRNNF